MGLPATAFLANNGRHVSYPFYVWLADVPDGPLWRLMDREFDHWDRRTGEHLAFFVDPFQKPEWARDFLGMMEFDRGLTDEVLRATGAAREFYRDRLSMNLAQHFRIGREFLPAAIVALEWDAPSAAVCFLREDRDLALLFDSLIELARSERVGMHQGSRGRGDPGHVRAFLETRRVAQRLADRFDVRLYEFPRPLAAAVQAALDPESVHYFVEQLRDKSARNSWILGTGDQANARGFGLSRAYVALASLDDLLDVAGEIDQLSERLVDRYGGDPDVERLRSRVRRLADLKEEIDRLARSIKRAIEAGDEAAMIDAFEPFQERAREFDLIKHLIATLGARTFGALAQESRDAVAASELIYLLSLKINDLRRDLTGAIVGYWKASEREGRRVLLELLDRQLVVAYRDREGTVAVGSAEVQGFTLGSLRKVFRGLEVSPRERAPQLPSRVLGNLLTPVIFGDRNQAIHFSLLTSPVELEAARSRMGCKNPGGVLPLLVSCLEAIDPGLVPDVGADTAPPSGRELNFMAPDGRPGPAVRDWESRIVPVPAIGPTRQFPRDRQVRGVPTGTVGQWVVTDARSKKGKPLLRLRDGAAQGVLHDRSQVPEDLESGKAYTMRVVAGGAMHQLEWVPCKP